jgi:hypothetical protein
MIISSQLRRLSWREASLRIESVCMTAASSTITCNVCGATFVLDDATVTASAELTAFVDAHYEHGSISIGLVVYPHDA